MKSLEELLGEANGPEAYVDLDGRRDQENYTNELTPAQIDRIAAGAIAVKHEVTPPTNIPVTVNQ